MLINYLFLLIISNYGTVNCLVCFLGLRLFRFIFIGFRVRLFLFRVGAVSFSLFIVVRHIDFGGGIQVIEGVKFILNF